MYSFRSLTAIRRRITEHDVLVDGPACPVKAINPWCLGVKETPVVKFWALVPSTDSAPRFSNAADNA